MTSGLTRERTAKADKPYGLAAALVTGSLVVFGTLAWFLPALLGKSPYSDHPVVIPGAIKHPPAIWFFNFGIPVVATVVLIALTVQSVRRKSLSWYWLFFVSGVASFWVETIADWSIYLTYSPAFATYQLPFNYPWHVWDNPAFIPFAYGVYWGVFPYVVLRINQFVSKRFGWGGLKSLLIVGIPFSYCWDLLVEGTATYFGWWTYEPPLGPHFSWVPLGGAGIQTLIVPPLLMIIWPNVVAWMAGDPKDGTSPRIARLFRIPAHRDLSGIGTASLHELATPTRSSWDARYELLKIGGWISVFYWAQVTQLLPVVLVRYVFGHESVFAPFPNWL